MKQILLVVTLTLCGLEALAAETYDDYIRAGIQYRNGGDLKSAESSFRQAYTIARDRREAASLLGLTLAFQERYDDANEVIDRALADAPDDINLRLAKARVISFEGDFGRSLNLIDEVLEDDPANLDAANLGARIALYQQRFIVGRESFARVLEMDPGNLEAMIGLHDSERYLGNAGEAEAALLLAEAINPSHPDVLSRRGKSGFRAGPRHQLVTGFELSEFDQPLSNWYDRYIEYRHYADNENQQFLRLEHDHRFDLHDSMLEAGVMVRARLSTPLTLAIAMSEKSDFLPEWRLRGELGFPIFRGSPQYGATLGHLRLAQSRYRTGNVTQLNLDVDYYLVSANAWLTPGLGLVHDENGNLDFSWRLGYNHQLSPRLRAGIDYTNAPDTDAGITAETDVWHAYLRYRVSNRTWLRIDGASSDRRGSYTRSFVAVTLGYRF